MIVEIWVHPGARGAHRAAVGGAHDGALIVRVAARAIDGQATEAALTAIAEAFGLRRRQVSLVSGKTSRRKRIEVDGATPAALAVLLAQPSV